ncbi:hypothetical protein AKJ09_10592 [Labilithrix luteola]|uniref:DUF7481 domain-containing protein n=1 Tax=Labilithrix luteola TaxID=1391654 RepID=A0A0K1QDU2_9BACT|nr:hypothetical protein [Labilithrix luteola]AKV03929.1 hypothetical protein AKJ09_10592 [Labilithrix luteola]
MADGIFVLDGLYDTKLGMMCVPAIARDGVERCVPRDLRPMGPYIDAADGGPDYSDACTTPLITLPKSACADPARVFIRSRARRRGNRDGLDYWRIGAKTSPTTIFSPRMSSCAEGPPDATSDYYELGAPLAPTDFVAFVRRDVAVSSALVRAVVLEGEDGSRLQSDEDFIDVARGTPCEFAVADDGVERCMPVSAIPYQGGPFGNCQKVVAAPVYDCARGPDQCVPIAATEFPPTAAGSTPAHSRLVERTQLVGGVPVKQSAIYDSQIDDTCTFEKAADGKVRCLPASAAFQIAAFADATCTTPLFTANACGAAPRLARVIEGSACDPIVRIHAIKPAEKVFQRQWDGCVEVPQGGGEAFVTAEEVPAATFAEATSTSP